MNKAVHIVTLGSEKVIRRILDGIPPSVCSLDAALAKVQAQFKPREPYSPCNLEAIHRLEKYFEKSEYVNHRKSFCTALAESGIGTSHCDGYQFHHIYQTILILRLKFTNSLETEKMLSKSTMRKLKSTCSTLNGIDPILRNNSAIKDWNNSSSD